MLLLFLTSREVVNKQGLPVGIEAEVFPGWVTPRHRMSARVTEAPGTVDYCERKSKNYSTKNELPVPDFNPVGHQANAQKPQVFRVDLLHFFI